MPLRPLVYRGEKQGSNTRMIRKDLGGNEEGRRLSPESAKGKTSGEKYDAAGGSKSKETQRGSCFSKCNERENNGKMEMGRNPQNAGKGGTTAKS